VKWLLDFDARAEREIKKLNPQIQERILRFLKARLVKRSNPRELGEALSGELSGYWKYRVGDYRIIAKIEDQTITIYIIAIGHRSEVYR
jgi:mRNA interferase RelE/StbE